MLSNIPAKIDLFILEKRSIDLIMPYPIADVDDIDMNNNDRYNDSYIDIINFNNEELEDLITY
jgi:hypothetical protein